MVFMDYGIKTLHWKSVEIKKNLILNFSNSFNA